MTEFLDVAFACKGVDERGRFAGYGSVFDVVDRQQDVVAPGAFARTLRERRPADIKLLWQHAVEEPIGVIEAAREDARGLLVEGRLLLDVQRAREAYALMGAGALDGLSIGYTAVAASRDARTGVRTLLDVDLWEVSLVTFPANPRARISAYKTEAAALAALHDALRRAARRLRAP